MSLVEPTMTTLASYSMEEVRRKIGHHVIMRDDPYFGRRGRIRHVVPDKEHGFLVCVVIFGHKPNSHGNWVDLHCPPPAARAFWPPSKIEVV